jgi:hypothetical protein
MSGFDYNAFLIEGHTYQFPDVDDRQAGAGPVTVTAGRCAWGNVWLLYEHTPSSLKLRYWVMPDGGIAHAFPGAAVIHQPGAATLAAQPAIAHVRDLDDITDGLDPFLRRQINDLLDQLDARG